MSNISRINRLSSGYPPHPYRPSGPPRLREARGIGPSPFSRQPSFVKFFRQSAEGQKTPKKEPTDLPQAHCGAREKDHLAGGRRRYTPRPPATQELFSRDYGKYAFSTEPGRATDELWKTPACGKYWPVVRQSDFKTATLLSSCGRICAIPCPKTKRWDAPKSVANTSSATRQERQRDPYGSFGSTQPQSALWLNV